MFCGRRAGQVRRYHTLPTLQQQTVADHSWHVLRIYMEIWGHPEGRMTAWILHHDSAEHLVGDVPFGAKERIPDLGYRLAQQEEEIIMRSVAACSRFLEDWERWRLKACDLLEMVEFGCEEARLGNQYGRDIAENAGKALLVHCEVVPDTLPPTDTSMVLDKHGEIRNAGR